MSATRKSDFFWSDWLGDQAVRRLTPAERGVWIDLLALASGGTPTGYVCDDKARPLTLEEIARVTNAGSPDEVARHIASIVEKGAASRDRTGRLFNRRMVREAELRAKRSRAGKIGADHTNLINKQLRDLSRQMTRQPTRQIHRPPPRPFLQESKITSTSSLAAREEEKKVATPAADSEQADGKRSFEVKKPNETTKQELDEFYVAKRAREAQQRQEATTP
jgi:hypothetical protein